MARYIDAEKFAKEICELPAIDEHSANAVIFLLYEQPTADVVEVKHGGWTKTGDRKLDIIYAGRKCSECGYVYCGDLTNYCPNCGAKMDGGSKA